MNRKVALGAVAAAAVIAAGWYLALWRPINKDLAHARTNLAAAEAAQVTARVQHAALLRKEKDLPGVEQTAAALESAAPTTLGVDTLIDQISAIAASSGVTWHSESVSQASPASSGASASSSGGALESSSVTVSVTGTFAQLLAFDTALSNTPRLITVSTLGFAGGASAGSSGSSTTGSGSSSAGTSGSGSSSTTSSSTSGSGSSGIGSSAQAPMTISISATMYQADRNLPAAPKTP